MMIQNVNTKVNYPIKHNIRVGTDRRAIRGVKKNM